MKRLIAPLGALFMLTVASCAASSSYHRKPFGVEENGTATVMVKQVDTGIGTGMVVDVGGLVVTNAHVVSEKSQIIRRGGKEIKIEGTGRFLVCWMVKDVETCTPAILVAKDEKLDLALLKTARRFPRSVIFADDSALEGLDFVYTWASVTIILPPSPFNGRFVGRIMPGRVPIDHQLLVFDLSTNQGGSGAPIFDDQGRCVGTITSVTPPPGRSLTLAIPSGLVVGFLKKYGVEAQVAPQRRK